MNLYLMILQPEQQKSCTNEGTLQMLKVLEDTTARMQEASREPEFAICNAVQCNNGPV